jgi:4-hydroxy-2-oxoheptanedioate aldolase
MSQTTPVNRFKQAIQQQAQIGLWLGLASAYSAEVVAPSGYDWLLIDGEHAPNDLRSTLSQLQTLAAYPASHPVVRIATGDVALATVAIKQMLDIGAQTLLVPMVDTPEQAAHLVRACRYPTADDTPGQGGLRGMGSALARASRWQSFPNYVHEANDQVCLLVQVETAEGLAHLDATAATPGVDGVFIGPADLSASMGHPGNAGHPAVQAAIEGAIARIQGAGKAAGILALSDEQAHKWLRLGARFVAVGVDTILLRKSADALLAQFKPQAA